MEGRRERTEEEAEEDEEEEAEEVGRRVPLLMTSLAELSSSDILCSLTKWLWCSWVRILAIMNARDSL